MSASHNFPLISKSPYRSLMLSLFSIMGAIWLGALWKVFPDSHIIASDKILVMMANVMLWIILLNTFIRTAPLYIDENGLNRIIFGKACYRMEWNQIKRIRVKKIPDFSRLNSTITVYFLDKDMSFHVPNTKNAPFFFNDRRNYLPELLDVINTRCIQPYRVSVIDYRESPPVNLGRL